MTIKLGELKSGRRQLCKCKKNIFSEGCRVVPGFPVDGHIYAIIGSERDTIRDNTKKSVGCMYVTFFRHCCSYLKIHFPTCQATKRLHCKSCVGISSERVHVRVLCVIC